MNLITHILSVLLLGKIMHLNGFEWILAFVFGVLIDIDHLVKLPIYMKQKYMKQKIPRKTAHWDWRTPIQEPVSYLWVIPMSLFLKSYVPVIFFTLHLALDYMMSFSKKPFFPFANFTINDTAKFKRDVVLQIILSGLICFFLIL